MGNYLISGLPGTGKSTIGDELAKLGNEVLHTDDTLGYYGVIETAEPIERPENAGRDWYVLHGWVWDKQKFLNVLNKPRHSHLFICGGSRDEHKYYHYFDKIFVLYAPDEVMRHRLQTRDPDHPSTPLFIDRMVERNTDTHKRAQEIGGLVIDTTQPLQTCVQQILNAVNEN